MPATPSVQHDPSTPQAKTRSGTAYGWAPARGVVCSTFPLTQCLRDAVEAEDHAMPNIALKNAFNWLDDASDPASVPSRKRAASAAPTPASSSAESTFTAPLLPPRAEVVQPTPPHATYCYDTHSERNKARKKAKRTHKRDQNFAANTHQPQPKAARDHVGSASRIPVDITLEALPADSSGYNGASKNSGARKMLNYEELLAQGYRLIEWDGKETILLVDAETSKIFAVLVGMPQDAKYQEDCRSIHQFMLDVGRQEAFKPKDLDHKRGKFPVFNTGILWGHGPPAPYNLRNDGHEEAVGSLLGHGGLQRIALLQDAAFKTYQPKLYDYYHQHTIPLRCFRQDLRPNWARSVFSACAFNLGPQVITFPHRDSMNLATGFCGIHAFGEYDFMKGGHLVLEEARLVVQFPPGALILVPSAVVTHGNTPVQAHETRSSFTQYSSGAMFRYVDNGLRTEDQLKRADPAGYQKMLAAKADRWKKGLALWSTVEELLDRAGLGPEEGELIE